MSRIAIPEWLHRDAVTRSARNNTQSSKRSVHRDPPKLSWLLPVLIVLVGVIFDASPSFAHDPHTGIHPKRLKSNAAPHTWAKVADNARTVGTILLNDYPATFDFQNRNTLRETLHRFDHAAGTEYELVVTPPASMTAEQKLQDLGEVRHQLEATAQEIADSFKRISALVEVGTKPTTTARSVSFATSSGALVIHRQTTHAAPDFIIKRIDLRTQGSRSIDLGAGDCFCVLELENVPSGENRFSLTLHAQEKPIGRVELTTTVPHLFPINFKVRDEKGNPLSAAVGLYSGSGELMIPSTALDFSFGGDPYQPTRYREQYNTRYWPGEDGFKRSFFVDHEFTVSLPAGSYRVIGTKGPEYLPVDFKIAVGENDPSTVTIELRHWIDMSAQGWYSGDAHVHYTRMDDAANQRLIKWLDAEDVHVGNVLLMGDARERYFPQYAFGKSGRFVLKHTALIPGQEDPRTNILGHTIFLNIQKPIRQPDGLYYLYDAIFAQAHHQGALGGYAHVVGDLFFVHRDMTLNIPRNKADFVEICEFGAIDESVYYEFLNLGFKIPAIGGSDAPWGGTVGDSRVYAYTGKSFDADEWFAAVKKGRTFVTVGPQLEFTVDGSFPGDELTPNKGAILKIHAKEQAGYLNFALEPLEIVVNGEVVRSAKATDNSASLDFELPADHSLWIAARTKGAHTSPVYVTVERQRHWNLAKVPALLEKREQQIKEVESLIDHPDQFLPPGHRQNWEHADKLRRSSDGLRQSIKEARAIYQQLNQEYQRERSTQ